MKRKFVQYFLDCITKITWNHNITSFVEYFLLRSCPRYLELISDISDKVEYLDMEQSDKNSGPSLER